MKTAAILILIAAIVAAPATPVMAATPQETQALALADRLVRDAHGAMTEEDADSAARARALEGVISAAFDFAIWEKFLLKDIGDGFTEAQRAEFRSLLPGFLARLYFDQFGKGLDAAPVIKEARTVRRDVLVRAAIPRANGRNLPVDWRIRDESGRGPRVIDVMVGGASFLILKREEFRAVYDSGGAEGLLAHMRAASSG